MPNGPQRPTRTLLDWLLLQHPETPRGRAKRWIATGRVSVGGVVVRQPHQTFADPGSALELRQRHPDILDCGAGCRIHPRLSLLYLDAALAVVNKGPGLLSVPAPAGGISALSIVAGFLAGGRNAPGRGAAGPPVPAAYRRLRPLPVHRLDQYTSGVFCMATNPASRCHLIEQVKTHAMQREYVAFVEGRPDPAKGVWRQWTLLSRDEFRQRVLSEEQAKAAGANAVQAVTHYEVLAEYPLDRGARIVTKLRLRLETGRKHQIRVQAAHAGLPLVGDRVYNPAYGEAPPPGKRIEFSRQALHAQALTLEHPDRSGSRMTWTAPLPEDLRQLEAALRRGRV